MTAEILNERQTAALLGCSRQTLARWRMAGKGPPFSRLGAMIRYEREIVLEWIAERREKTAG